MKKLFKKAIAVVLTSAMALTVGIPAFANNSGEAMYNDNHLIQEDAAQAINDFLAEDQYVKDCLNQVAQSEPTNVTEKMLYDDMNTVITEEVRVLQVNKDISIVNTRTLTEKATNRSISDSYELFYQGTTGAGKLTANYSYTQEGQYGETYTTITDASGSASRLQRNLYEVSDIYGTYSNSASPWQTASVNFLMLHNILYTPTDLSLELWREAPYEHKVEFYNNGTYQMFW